MKVTVNSLCKITWADGPHVQNFGQGLYNFYHHIVSSQSFHCQENG